MHDPLIPLYIAIYFLASIAAAVLVYHITMEGDNVRRK